MGIIFPGATVARRWNGALEARLKRAPLEEFLKSRGLAAARSGVAQETDDVTRATMHMIEAALKSIGVAHSAGLEVSAYPTVGYLACIASRTLAGLIAKPDVWRIAALVSTAKLLTPLIGLTDAAVTSAACVRRFERQTSMGSAIDVQLAQAVAAAVWKNHPAALADAVALMALCLGHAPLPLDFAEASVETRLLA